jgi:hypothetical protein
LINIIKEFDLAINAEEFFSPIGLKENFTFSDFCYLFKSSDHKEGLLRSFSSGFHIKEKADNLFPIAIINKALDE